MNARTLIITAGAIVALAAPTVANARMLPVKQPSKHVVKTHTTKPQVTKRPGGTRIVSPRVIYIYYPAPAVQAATSLEQLLQDYNNDLIAHGLDPVDVPQSTPAPASEPAPEAAPENTASDSSQASEASLAAAATTMSETVASTATDDMYQDC